MRFGRAPVLVAPDDFKGTFSAPEVAAALARGVRAGGLDAEELPVADGGGGTMDVLVRALGGELRAATVSDPLGRPVEARFGLLGDGRTAVVEMAQASGLALLAENERDAWAATSRGTGELIAAAADAGARRVLVAVGGSATTDGGEGALAALEEAAVDPGLELEVMSDVRSPSRRSSRATVAGSAPFCGPKTRGASSHGVPRRHRSARPAWSADDRRGRRARRRPVGAPRCAPRPGRGVRARRGRLRSPHARRPLRGHRRGAARPADAPGKVVGEVAVGCRQAGVGCHAVVGGNELSAFEARLIDLASVTEARSLLEIEAAGRALAEAT